MAFTSRCHCAWIVSTLLCGVLHSSGAANAQSMPDTENGRYTLAPVADGVLRLDTRTGTMSTCNAKLIGWACYAMPDEREALDAEIGRLQRITRRCARNWRSAIRRRGKSRMRSLRRIPCEKIRPGIHRRPPRTPLMPNASLN